jgi:hypothetical protein
VEAGKAPERIIASQLQEPVAALALDYLSDDPLIDRSYIAGSNEL